METRNMYDCYRPPPTVPTGPRGYPNKRPRRDHSPPPRGHARGPPVLVPVRPHSPPLLQDFKGRRAQDSWSILGPAKAEASDAAGDEDRQSPDLDQAFNDAVDGIFVQTNSLLSLATNSGQPQSQVLPRVVASIQGNLFRLREVYRGMVAAVDGCEEEISQLHARENQLQRALDHERAANWKIDCATQQLRQQIDALSKEAKEQRSNFDRMKREIEEKRATIERQKRSGRDMHACVAKKQEEIQRLQALVRERDIEREKLRAELQKVILGRDSTQSPAKEPASTQSKPEPAPDLRSGEGEQVTQSQSHQAPVPERDVEREEAAAEISRLQSLVRERDSFCEDAKAENDRLHGQVREREADLEKYRAETARLVTLLRDKDAELERQRSEISNLESLIREHEASSGKEKAEFIRLRDLCQQKQAEAVRHGAEIIGLRNLTKARDAEVETLRAQIRRQQGSIQQLERVQHAADLPVSPVSPLEATQPFLTLNGQTIPELYEDPVTRRSSQTPYIESEALDRTALAIPSVTQADGVQDPARRLAHLGAGVTDVLCRVYQIDAQKPRSDVLLSFVERLGSVSEIPPINTIPAAGLEERFAELCLLFPDRETTTEQFEHLANLITSLIKAEHGSSPRSGLAFLEAMATLRPASSSPAGTTLDTKTALLALMICELCRLFEFTFPTAAPVRYWDIGSILGCEVYEAAEKLAIGKLAYALRSPDRSGTGHSQTLKEHLKANCLNEFCVFSKQTADGGAQTEIGLLHCGEGSGCFLIIDFGERSLGLWIVGWRQCSPMRPSLGSLIWL
ncbi:hypothetical protein N656DRAFT_798014 [Canariomyces notabilis]|uniref:Uncharacterized protein n=1 Tax=Canariomyces notabilis TaxID=2074819 RepID=A0AAN6TEB8_9PEZI|nr:hypothetical protein N656DRAFT_798014 [Canariomyces arenarius]